MDIETHDEGLEPILQRAGTGYRWLALSRPRSGLRIAVIGRDETHAREQYRRRLAAWVASPD